MLLILLALAASVSGPDVERAGTREFEASGEGAVRATPAVEAARRWLALVDRNGWQPTWAEASALFRARITAEAWAAAVTPVRAPLGAVRSRQLSAITTTASLPGAPPGRYELVLFGTDFAQRQGAVETVVMVEEDGRWGVAGYFIR